MTKVLAYKVKIDGRKIHYRKDKWEALIKSAIERGLYEFGYEEMTNVISVHEIYEPTVRGDTA